MMLVEINLLPRKEPRKFGFLAALAIFTSLFLVTAALYFWQIHSTNQQLKTVNKQIAITSKIAENQIKQSQLRESSNSVNSLKSSINWIQASKIETVPILDELTSLLPERGFILSYQSETESETVQLTVQFDTANDAAYYLNRLNHSKMVTEASISSVNSNAISNETTVNMNNSAAASVTGGNSSDQSTATGNNGDQSANLNNENNPAGINAAVSTEKNTPQADSSRSNKQELPRYTAQFTIKLNYDGIKKLENKNQATEGVAGS
ncbi:PilN domain-containing protein [Bacillota bacterium Lsc_1132]